MKTIKIVAAAFLLIIAGAELGLAQTGHDLFQQALVKERADGDLRGAIDIYERIAQEFTADRQLAAKALVQLGQCYEKLGSTEAVVSGRFPIRTSRVCDLPFRKMVTSALSPTSKPAARLVKSRLELTGFWFILIIISFGCIPA